MRTIRTVPGIGDFIFLAQKLINQSEKFDIIISSTPPIRSHQLAELLPQLINSVSFEEKLGYNKVKRNSYNGSWSGSPKDEMYLEANTHLEAGNRIESFLPDLKTSYLLDYNISDEDKKKAAGLLCNIDLAFRYENNDDFIAGQVTVDAIITEYKYIGIYTSSYNNSKHMSGWGQVEWLELIRLIQKHNPLYKFVFLGAEYDLGISEQLMKVMNTKEYINTIGQKLPVVIEILKRLHCFIGFQSGLSIINETIAARQTVMLYNKALSRMMNTWPDPARIESGQYKGCIFCEPSAIFEWLVKNEKI